MWFDRTPRPPYHGPWPARTRPPVLALGMLGLHPAGVTGMVPEPGPLHRRAAEWLVEREVFRTRPTRAARRRKALNRLAMQRLCQE